jgi:aminomethyltransferase
VVRVLQSQAPQEISVTNLHEEFAVLALQGPDAHAVIKSLGLNPTMDYMAFAHVSIGGCQVILCRTGYTGEHGYEIVPDWDDASVVWDVLVQAMEAFGGEICGLGSRDTLRTEMGYPLHGHELTLSITPFQASAGWAIGWKKENFRGAGTLRSQREEGAVRTMRALKSNDRGIPRAGMLVKSSQGVEVGVITSGTFSPSLKVGIALALIDPGFIEGDELEIDVRGRTSWATIVSLPFSPSHVR